MPSKRYPPPRWAWRMRWARLLCRLSGHQWDEIASGMLGVCGRCYQQWPYSCRNCMDPVHGPEDWVGRNHEHHCFGTNNHHTV